MAKSSKTSREGHNKGKTLGLNVKSTWAHLFKQNAKKRQSDEQLLKFMQKEFPGHDAAYMQDVKGVRALRGYFNAGKLTDSKPGTPSVRYEDGKPVEGRVRSGSKSRDKKSGGKGKLKLRVKVRGPKAVASRKAA